jgi:predicted amidohydrolase YtcJ
MKPTLPISLLLVISTVLFLSIAQAQTQKSIENDVADTIYRNGKIYTVNEAQPWADAVAIKDGKFLAVGSNMDVEAMKGDRTKIIDLNGAFVMPGIGDSHMHPAMTMPRRAFCSLPGSFLEPTEEDIVNALKKCLETYPKDRPWVIASGATFAAMSKETLSREFLDKLIPDRPAFIEDETGGHQIWFNTLAMEAAGVDKSFVDNPPEAFFDRTEDGDLSGVANEGAVNPFIAVLPPTDTELRKIAISRLLEDALSKGVTMFGDAYVFETDLEAYGQLNKEGEIKQHAVLYLKGNLGTAELTPVADIERWWNDHDLPGTKGVKLGMGGSLESISEALIDGYAPDAPDAKDGPFPVDDAVPDRNSNPVIPAEEFAKYIAQLDAAGFQVIVHAIGDGTVRATIDGYETVIKARGGNSLRHRIDHCSLVHEDDFQRLIDLDISCTIWPPLNAPGGYNLGAIQPVLKDKTWARMYPNRSMLDAGVRLNMHTDAPAAPLWPWWGMEASATRMNPKRPDLGAMGVDQVLTVPELIKIYTINTAWALRLEEETGSIESGKFADMIVLNHDLLEVPLTDLHKTEVQKTIIKGEVVYSAN